MRSRWYVVNKSAPGNPWGPFATKAEAKAFMVEISASWPNSTYYLQKETI